jgi:hypothetical protein
MSLTPTGGALRPLLALSGHSDRAMNVRFWGKGDIPLICSELSLQ